MATSLKSDDTSPSRFGRSPPGTAADAAQLGIEITGLDAGGIAAAVKRERERQWQEEHREYIEAHNAWVEEHGLPLARYRVF